MTKKHSQRMRKVVSSGRANSRCPFVSSRGDAHSRMASVVRSCRDHAAARSSDACLSPKFGPDERQVAVMTVSVAENPKMTQTSPEVYQLSSGGTSHRRRLAGPPNRFLDAHRRTRTHLASRDSCAELHTPAGGLARQIDTQLPRIRVSRAKPDQLVGAMFSQSLSVRRAARMSR